MKYLLFICMFLLILACNKEASVNFATYTVANELVQNTVSLTGRVEAAQQISIMAPDDITVLKLEASNGLKVKKDDVLCKLDPTKALEAVRAEQLKLEQLQVNIKTNKLRLETQKRDVEKTKRLFASGAVSQDDRDKQMQDLEIQSTQLVVQENEIKNAEANLEKLKISAELLEVKSPFDAVVTFIWTPKESFIPGSSVKKGDLLFKLSSEGKMVIKATLRERDVNYFYQGQKIPIKFPSIPGTEVEGIVKLVDSSATVDKDSGVATFRLIIEFTPVEAIKTGMEAAIDLVVNKKEGALAVPRTALNMSGSESVEVMVVSGSSKIKRPVKIGLIGDLNVEVISGLNHGESVLVNYEE